MVADTEQPIRVELDTNTNNLLALWETLHHDALIETQSGQIKANIIFNALIYGIKTGRINFVWKNEKKPQPPTTVLNGQTITVTFDQASLTKLEKDLDSLLPGQITPYIEDPAKLIIGILKKTPHEKRTTLPSLAPINGALITTYNFYQQIP